MHTRRLPHSSTLRYTVASSLGSQGFVSRTGTGACGQGGSWRGLRQLQGMPQGSGRSRSREWNRGMDTQGSPRPQCPGYMGRFANIIIILSPQGGRCILCGGAKKCAAGVCHGAGNVLKCLRGTNAVARPTLWVEADGGRGLKQGFRNELKNALYIVVGLLICSAAYNCYLIPNEIAPGGFTGIGQLVNRLSGGRIAVGTMGFILNVPLFALSMRSLGLRFGLRSFLASLGLSLAIDWVPFPMLTNDLLLAAVFGGVLGGIGFGLILRGNATTGGSDMLATLINSHIPAVRVSVGVFAVDGLVVLASAFVFDSTAAMYALISTFIMNVVMDLVLEGPSSARSYYIISRSADEIAHRVMEEMNRGATSWIGKGMFSGEDRPVLLCVINRFETMRLRNIVFSVDPNAFVIATNVYEVLGEGFKAHGK